jgi:hypothetical protein
LTTNPFRLSLLLSLLLLGPTAFGQSGTKDHPAVPDVVESKSLDLGQLDGVNYTNDYFGFSLSVPQTWTVVSAQRVKTVVDQLSKQITGDQNKKDQIDASMQRSVILLSVTKVPAGQPDNAAFMLVAERLPLSSLKTGVDVIELMKTAFKGTNVNPEFQGETQIERIGGADFAVARIKNTTPAGTFLQKVYVTTKYGYAIELFYTYLNEADLAAFDSIVASMKLK